MSLLPLCPHRLWLYCALLWMKCSLVLSHSVMSDSLQPHGLKSTRLLCPWGFSRQEYWSGLSCHPPGSVPLVSLIFLKKSLVFPILLFPSVSLHCSLKNAFLSLPAIGWNSTFRWVYLSFPPWTFDSLLFSAICKASSDNHLPCCISFSWGWFSSLPPVQCYGFPSVFLQALCQSDLIPWIYLSLPLELMWYCT